MMWLKWEWHCVSFIPIFFTLVPILIIFCFHSYGNAHHYSRCWLKIKIFLGSWEAKQTQNILNLLSHRCSGTPTCSCSRVDLAPNIQWLTLSVKGGIVYGTVAYNWSSNSTDSIHCAFVVSLVVQQIHNKLSDCKNNWLSFTWWPAYAVSTIYLLRLWTLVKPTASPADWHRCLFVFCCSFRHHLFSRFVCEETRQFGTRLT